ncbi:hypothetical protein V1509DRAFT_30394 [Lipomyces kononenkoae]
MTASVLDSDGDLKNAWLIDNGASSHICCQAESFDDLDTTRRPQLDGLGGGVHAQGVGTVTLTVNNGATLTLTGVLWDRRVSRHSRHATLRMHLIWSILAFPHSSRPTVLTSGLLTSDECSTHDVCGNAFLRLAACCSPFWAALLFGQGSLETFNEGSSGRTYVR